MVGTQLTGTARSRLRGKFDRAGAEACVTVIHLTTVRGEPVPDAGKP